jgi:excisionase family DNA binding protein
MLKEIHQELLQIKTLLLAHKKLLDMDEFCLYAGISKSYAYHLTSAGKIKFYKPAGKLIYFDIEDINEFLMQNPIDFKSKKKNLINKTFIKQNLV